LGTALTPIGSVPRQFWQVGFTCYGIARAAPLPEAIGNYEGINIALLPPLVLLACGVDVVVVDGAKRDGELIAHLQA
jgi:hypothetical protein